MWRGRGVAWRGGPGCMRSAASPASSFVPGALATGPRMLMGTIAWPRRGLAFPWNLLLAHRLMRPVPFASPTSTPPTPPPLRPAVCDGRGGGGYLGPLAVGAGADLQLGGGHCHVGAVQPGGWSWLFEVNLLLWSQVGWGVARQLAGRTLTCRRIFNPVGCCWWRGGNVVVVWGWVGMG